MAKVPLIAIIGLAIASGLSLNKPQDPPTTPVSGIPPLPAAKTYSLGANSTMTVTYRMVQEPDLPVYTVACQRSCRGQKHLAHEQCDDTCDDPCRDRHPAVIHATLLKYSNENSQDSTGRNGFRQNLAKFGITEYNADDLMDFMSREVMSKESLKKFDKNVSPAHWAKPCTHTFRDYNGAAFYLYADIALFRSAPLPNDPNHQIKGPVSTIKLAHLGIPIDGFKDHEFVSCRCAIIKEGKDPEDPPQTTGSTTGGVTTGGTTGATSGTTTAGTTAGGQGVGSLPPIREGGFVWVYEPMQKFIPNPEYEEKIKLECEVANMNECTWSAENFGPDPIDILIYPGVQLTCIDDSMQTMCSSSLVRMHLPPLLSRGPAAVERVSIKGRVLCLNMTKDQPTGKSKYKIGPPSNPGLIKLAQLFSKEAIQGPEGQIRAWIITDHATLTEIQEHMIFPRATPAQYLRSLHAVATVGGVDLTSPEYRKCLDPQLISAAPNSAPAIEWFVSVLNVSDRNGLLSALQRPGQFDAMWSDSNARLAPKNAADLTNALCKTGDSALIQQATLFLKAVPESQRAKVSAVNGLRGLGTSLLGSDEKTAEMVLDVYELYLDRSEGFYVRNIAKQFPPTLIDRAAKLAARIK